MERPTCGKVKGCRMQFTVVFHREIGVFGPQIGPKISRGSAPHPAGASAPDPPVTLPADYTPLRAPRSSVSPTGRTCLETSDLEKKRDLGRWW